MLGMDDMRLSALQSNDDADRKQVAISLHRCRLFAKQSSESDDRGDHRDAGAMASLYELKTLQKVQAMKIYCNGFQCRNITYL